MIAFFNTKGTKMTVRTTNQLPNAGFLRLRHIIGDPKANPPIPALIPISRTSWLNGVKSGIFPKKISLGSRTVVWRADDIYELINQLGKVA
jgi:predicted DNA-binding transcriptional regulator AlpA